MSKDKSTGSRRLQTDPFIKAAAHPTRQAILKTLQENDSLTTVERFLYFDSAEKQDAELMARLLELLSGTSDGTPPDLEDVDSVSAILRPRKKR